MSRHTVATKAPSTTTVDLSFAEVQLISVALDALAAEDEDAAAELLAGGNQGDDIEVVACRRRASELRRLRSKVDRFAPPS